MTLRERAEDALGLECVGHVTAERLDGFDEAGSPPGLTLDAAHALGGEIVLLSSRCALEPFEGSLPDGPARLVMDGHTVGWIVPEGSALPAELSVLTPDLEDAADGAVVALAGEVLSAPWDLVRRNPERITRDIAARRTESGTPEGVHRIGAGLLSLGADAVIEPGVTLDLRQGPVWLDDGVRVEGPARLVGPLYIGRGSTVFGGHVASSAIGPVCKVRGEIADSVLLGWTNKAHDGYLGHALVGRWVNLGALTTNSDLKNNYGPVTVWTPDGPVDTGLMKVGCFLGDHVKTGIGTVLNTGTVIGPGSNVFGGAMPPTHVPAFSWGQGAELVEYRLDKFLEGAERAMGRRNVPLTAGVRRVLERAWHETAATRRGRG
jgi:UDP-N-acetylglucosamine diphosphorylase/glucosamine-1-phosphate N-acetyltransferase